MLHTILSGAPTALRRQNLALYEVAAQITGNNDAVASLLAEHMESADQNLKVSVLEEFAKRGGEFWLSLWRRLKKQNSNQELLNSFQWAIPIPAGALSSAVPQRLSKIIASEINPFVHEAAILKLALALVKGISDKSLPHGLSPNQIIVKLKTSSAEWKTLWRPNVNIECDHRKSNQIDPRFVTPTWINSDFEEGASIYWIGMVLRSAAVGANDFTGGRWKARDIAGYRGLRTGWFKRRMGMMHSPESLVGEYATLSDWISELIKKCLQWPGFESTYLEYGDVEKIEDLQSLKEALELRLSNINDLYCTASETPCLVTNVKRSPISSDLQQFRLVTVQQLLPRASDFTKSDPKLNDPLMKRRNRNHLARLCQITYKTLEAKLHADNNGSRTCADLIVFPELGVHIDDMDLIKRLADKTHSMILAGMVFNDPNGKLVNTARWLIPSYRELGRQWVVRDQGKAFPIPDELKLGVVSDRPCQHVIEIDGLEEGPFRITAAICYDATDLKLVSDLKGKSDLFVIVAHNKDVATFDTMASALHYHMYQHVVVVNKGEFGGSTIQAPFKEPYERLISHAHGTDQISINVADLDLAAFRRKSSKKLKEVKTKPAG